MANYEIVWNARISGVTGTGVGLFLCYNGSAYVPATTANRALYTVIRGVITQNIVTSVAAVIQTGGDVEASVTGVTNQAYGYAVLDANGYAVWSLTQNPGDVVVGVFENGMLRLNLSSAAAASSNNEWIVLSVLDFGATGLSDFVNGGAVISDDSDGIENTIQAVRDVGGYLAGANYYIYFPPLPSGRHYNVTRQINFDNDSTGSTVGVVVSGGVGAPSIYQSGALISFRAAAPMFTNKTVTVSAVARTTAVPSDDRRLSSVFVTMSGSDIAGIASSVSVGDSIEATSGSYTNFNGFHTVVAKTATTITVSACGTAGSYPASITGLGIRRCDYIFYCRSREMRFESLLFMAYGSGTYVEAAIGTGPSPGAGAQECSALNFQDILLRAAGGAVAKHTVDVGREMCPTASSAYMLDVATGYPIAYCPPNCDFFTLDHCFADSGTTGYVLYTTNYTGQSRGHRVTNCAALATNGVMGKDYYCNGTSVNGSIAASLYEPVGGSLSGPLVKMGREQAQTMMVYPHVENVARIVQFERTSGVSQSQVLQLGGYLNLAGDTGTTGAVADWLYEVNNCTMEIVGAPILMTSNSNRGGGVNIFAFRGYRPRLLLIGCTLPHESQLNTGYHFLTDSLSDYAYITMIGCRVFDGAALYECDNLYNHRFTANFNATYNNGNRLSSVLGLSGTTVQNVNFIGTATVTGAATTAVWTFGTAETSATKLYGWAVPISSTGGPAAGSNRVLTCAVTTTDATVTVEVAPGGVATVTFAIFLARGA